MVVLRGGRPLSEPGGEPRNLRGAVVLELFILTRGRGHSTRRRTDTSEGRVRGG